MKYAQYIWQRMRTLTYIVCGMLITELVFSESLKDIQQIETAKTILEEAIVTMTAIGLLLATVVLIGALIAQFIMGMRIPWKIIGGGIMVVIMAVGLANLVQWIAATFS